MSSLDGVIYAESGYANGNAEIIPDYKSVCQGNTNYRETVRVQYNPTKITLDAILFTYFAVINPTEVNKQGGDIGTQYQTGIYYTDEKSKEIVNRITDIVKSRIPNFAVEIKPLTNFYLAEEYHQKYLEKNPEGYCHINPFEISKVSKMVFDPGKYPIPSSKEIKEKLTQEQYNVTQNAATEHPFQNQYWNNFEKGIYVDIVTGEPLFTSDSKYHSSCGWPSFTKVIDENSVVDIEDKSIGMTRTEVRSRTGNSHLGHVFQGDSESPNGIRYCINSASLKFIPFDQMDEKGYGYLKKYIK